jgi:fibronectin-binding autotransporter adhesin
MRKNMITQMLKTSQGLMKHSVLAVVAAFVWAAGPALATTHTWTQTAGGAQSWEVNGNWSGGWPTPASGDTVDFSIVAIATNTTLTLQADRTAEVWKFGDTGSAWDWTIAASNKINLSGTIPTIHVVNRTATLLNGLDGSAGLTKTGSGTLLIGSTNNTYSGATVVSNGTLKLQTGASGTIVPLANIAATAQSDTWGPIANTVAWIGMDRGTQASPDKNALASNNYANHWTPGANLAWGKWDLDNTAANASFNIGNVFWWQYSQGGYNGRGMLTAKLYYSNMETDPGVPGDGNPNWTQFYNNTDGTAFPLSGGVDNHHAVVDLPGLNFAARWIGILPTSPTTDISGMGTILFTTADVPSGYLPSSTALSIASGAFFDLNGAVLGQTIASLSDSGVVTNGGGLATLTINPSSGSTTFSGSIGGPISLVKSGIATQVLAGASTYTGGTAVSNGTLLVNGSITGAVSVASGATLGGTGAITGNVMFATGALALFTHGAPLTFTGPVTLNTNKVHLILPDTLADGTYLLATNTTGNFSGMFAVIPVIDSGSTVSPNSVITTDASAVRLIVSSADIVPPTPNPMTFAVKPAALDATTVVMTATTATEGLSLPVEYSFTNTVNGSTSGWILSTVWTNTGLTAATTYAYRVKARDSATTPNETDWSLESDIVTLGWPATSLYWDGGTADIAGNGNGASQGGDGTWNTTLRNWDLGSAYPHVAWDNANNDTAVFGGTPGTVTLGTVAAGSVTFTNFTGTYTLTGGSLTNSGGITVAANAGAVTLSTPVGGSGGMVKNGSSTLTLNNTSTYTGGTVINGGTVNQATSVNGVFGTGPVTLNNGAVLNFERNTLTNLVVVNNGAFNGGNSFGDATTGPITLNGQLTVATAGTGNRHLSGIISGAGSILKTGSGVGSLYLYGANTYSGGTTNQGGLLGLGHTNALGTGTLWMDGDSQGLNAEANLNVGTGITNNIVLLKDCTIRLWGNWPPVDYDMLLSGTISGPGGITLTGGLSANKTLFLSGTNTYTGTTTINNLGNLVVSGSLASTNIVVSATRTLVLLNNTSLSTNTVLRYAVGATNTLSYTGKMYIQDLYTNNVPLPEGEYGSAELPQFITGTGRLNTGPLPPKGTVISFF